MSAQNGKNGAAEAEGLGYRTVSDPDEAGGDFLSEIDFTRILSLFRRNLILLFFIIGSCMGCGYLYLRYTKPVYESASSLRLTLKQNNVLFGSSTSEAGVNNLAGEIEFLKSPVLFEEIIHQGNLKISYFIKGKILDEERYKANPFEVKGHLLNEYLYNLPLSINIISQSQYQISYKIGTSERQVTGNFGTPLRNSDFEFSIVLKEPYTSSLIGIPFYFVVNSHEALQQYLTKNLKVEILNYNANVIGIYFKDYSPSKAKDIVNLIDTVYLEKTKANKNESNVQKSHFLDEQMKMLSDSLDLYENILQNFILSQGVASMNGDLEGTVSKIETLVEERLRTNEQLLQFETLGQLLERNIRLSEVEFPIELEENTMIAGYIRQLQKVQDDKELMNTSLKETTLAIKLKDTELERVKKKLLAVNRLQITRLKKKIDAITQKIARLEYELGVTPGKNNDYLRLKRMKDLYERFYLQMMDKKAEIGIAQAGTVSDFVILSSAILPNTPISPNKLIVYAICTGIGIVMSLLLIIAKYLLHNTFSNPRDLERVTSVPILGVIPAYTKGRMPVSRLIVEKYPRAAISEALRGVRTNLDFLTGTKKKKKLISITSTISGEGKTFVCMNLAGVIALSNNKVVILDLDMRRPKLHKGFEVENISGVSNILIGKQKWEDCIQKSSIPTLDYITAGPVPPNPSELILRPEFDALLEALYEHYDVIVIDTPPVGLVTDGILVMRKADVPLYVVRAEYSKRAFVKNINRLYEYQNFTRLALVLNAYKGGAGYGYSYNYQPDYYEEEKTKNSFTKGIISQFIK